MDQLDNEMQEIVRQYKAMDPKKLEETLKELKKCNQTLQKLSDLDMDLNSYFEESKNNNLVLTSSEFQDKIDEIGDDTLTVYISKAQIFKIYNHDDLDQFRNDDNTHYRKPETGPVHEVVRDLHPQKLTILFNKELSDAEIIKIKGCLVLFIQKNPALSKFNANMILVFKYNSKTEFCVSNLIMKDIFERDKMIEKFTKILRTQGAKELSEVIQLRQPPCDEVDGARFYKLPSSKVSLNPRTIDILDQLITTTSQSNQPIVVNINVTNTNTVNSNNINSNNVHSNNINGKKKTIKSFYKHIFDTKPPWFIEKEKVKFQIIEAAYREYFEDNTTTSSIISRTLNGKLFTPMNKAQRNPIKVLISFDELKSLFEK